MTVADVWQRLVHGSLAIALLVGWFFGLLSPYQVPILTATAVLFPCAILWELIPLLRGCATPWYAYAVWMLWGALTPWMPWWCASIGWFLTGWYFCRMPLSVGWMSIVFGSTLFLARSSNPLPLLLAIVLPKCGDILAWSVGRLVGKTPLAPTISPKKTWEGFFAAMAGVAMLGSISGGVVWGILGIISAILGQLGDLVESWYKRRAKKKDSGSIPGLGGILDLFDSLLFTLPFFALLTAWFPWVLS